VLKEFKGREVNTSMLKIYYNTIVSLSFLKLDTQLKKNTLINLDEYISEQCEMPQANFIYEENYDNEVKDDLYIGDIDKYTSGFDLLSRYFFLKRLQFQMNCISNGELENYRDSTFYLVGISYKYTPLTNERLYFPYSEGKKKYLCNYNVFEAYMYACEEMGFVFDSIDYDYVYLGCSAFEKFKFLASFQLAIDSNKKMLNKLTRQMASKNEYEKFMNVIKMLNKRETDEKKYLELLKDTFDKKSFDDKLGKMLLFSCFDERVWKTITPANRVYAVKKLNELLQKMFEINDRVLYFDNKRLIEVEAGKASIGNIGENNPKDIFNSLIYTYTYHYLLNNCDNYDVSEFQSYKSEAVKYREAIKNSDLAELKNCKLIKFTSKLAVESLVDFYNKVNDSEMAKKYNLSFFGKKEDFVYDLNKEINKKRKR